jgi:ceramide glucosyltransferase
MWLFREAGAPYLFLHALWNPAIRWRNCEFRLRWGGKAEAVLVRPSAALSPASPSGTDALSAAVALSSASQLGSSGESPLPPSYGEAIKNGGGIGFRHLLMPVAVK